MASVWFEGVDQLNTVAAQLQTGAMSAVSKAATVVRSSALQVEAAGKQFAPVDTGNLRNSIGTDLGPSGLSAEIGPTAEYGAFVEFGTERMAPHAYMGPALDRVSPSFVAAIEQLGDPLGG